MARWPVWHWLLVGAWLLALLTPGVQAQEEAGAIQLMQTVFGRIDDETPEVRWQYTARQSEAISVLVQAVAGNLDPYVQVIDESGRLLGENDDIAYPERIDAALEGVEVPRDETVTIRVTRYGFEEGDTAGEFALTLLPAYAAPLLWDSFSGERAWSADGSDLVAVEQGGGELALAAAASNALVWAAPEDAIRLPLRAYVQVEAAIDNEPDYWEYGLIFRQTSPTSYYLFSVSSRGDWAFMARAGASTWLHIQDWTEHPALSEPPEEAVLGVLMDGNEFAFFYNGVRLGTLTAEVHQEPGTVALGTGTIDQQEVMPLLHYDNLLVTVPLPPTVVGPEEEDGEPLTTWQSRDPAAIVEELAARRIVPAGGSQVMFVPDSFTSTSRAGMQTLPLGQGRTVSDFVMGATVTLESNSPQNGCGLIFRQESADRYSLFFLDGLGGYGVAEWALDRFQPAYYAMERPASPQPGQDRVALVALGERVWVYLNGELATVRPSEAVAGGVGIAALSFDGTFVNCLFDNTWLWTWS